jgi:hypothetical protein
MTWLRVLNGGLTSCGVWGRAVQVSLEGSKGAFVTPVVKAVIVDSWLIEHSQWVGSVESLSADEPFH